MYSCPTTGQSYEPFVLSVPNSNDCTSAGPDYIIITNELDCEQAHDQLNNQGLVTFPGYQGPISDISIPLGCILGGEVYFNYDPIGSANIAYTPICKYLAPGTSEPPAPYKLASLNTEDCSSAGVDYRPITDNIECQTAAASGFVGADFYYKDFCDVELYPDGCYLNNLNAGSVFYGNMTDGSADINSAPICKYKVMLTSVPFGTPSYMPSFSPSVTPSISVSMIPSYVSSMLSSILSSVSPSSGPSSVPSTIAYSSSAPSIIPSTTPSSRSDFPSSSPSMNCVDSIFLFKTNIYGVEYSNYCSWVQEGNESDVARKCKYASVSGHCPASCESCGCYDSPVEFLVWLDDEGDGGIWIDCEWTGKADMCDIPGVFHTCRKRCQSCTNSLSKRQSSLRYARKRVGQVGVHQ